MKSRGKGAPKKKRTVEGEFCCERSGTIALNTNQCHRVEEVQEQKEVNVSWAVAIEAICIKYRILKALFGVGRKPWEYTEFHDLILVISLICDVSDDWNFKRFHTCYRSHYLQLFFNFSIKAHMPATTHFP